MHGLILSLAGAWLVAVPAQAVVIECPDGTICAVAKPTDCGCVKACSEGSWVFRGEACSAPALHRQSRAPKAEDAPDAGDTIGGFVLLALLFVMYFGPSILASQRNHQQQSAIFVVNLLLGWTVIGWIAALIWAATAVRREREL